MIALLECVISRVERDASRVCLKPESPSAPRGHSPDRIPEVNSANAASAAVGLGEATVKRFKRRFSSAEFVYDREHALTL